MAIIQEFSVLDARFSLSQEVYGLRLLLLSGSAFRGFAGCLPPVSCEVMRPSSLRRKERRSCEAVSTTAGERKRREREREREICIYIYMYMCISVVHLYICVQGSTKMTHQINFAAHGEVQGSDAGSLQPDMARSKSKLRKVRPPYASKYIYIYICIHVCVYIYI